MLCPVCNKTDPECKTCGGDLMGIPIYDCPFRVVPKPVWELLSFLSDYRRGVLPVPGALLDQSNSYLVAMRILDSDIARLESELMESETNGRD